MSTGCLQSENKPSSRKIKKQSPINITKDVVIRNGLLKGSSLQLKYFTGDAEYIKITKTGFMCVCNNNSTLSASHFDKNSDFHLWQFHMHWSDTNKKGSEHCIDGKYFSGELHCVFWDKKYGTLDEAMQHCNGLTVLAIFLEVSKEDNPHLSFIIEAINDAIKSDEKQAVINDKFDLSKLLPEKRSYYSYQGSLTTPPYTECVSWIILHNRISISNPQLEVLRKIISHNARRTQDLHDRQVYASFLRVPKK